MPAKAAKLTLTQWVYHGIRDAILGGRLARGWKLPSTRQMAERHRISRRVVLLAYEQLTQEGYLKAERGAGTTVSREIPDDYLVQAGTPAAATQTARGYIPSSYTRPAKPFRPIEPDISEFPFETWAKLNARVMRRAGVAALAGGDLAGFAPLREAIAEYLGASRGVLCSPDHIVVVSGAQQALDLIARTVLAPGDAVWMEDPAYPGALHALENRDAKIHAVRVDGDGMDVDSARRDAPHARLAYLTPARQFGLGSTLSLPRRLALLRWAQEQNAVVVEDDYDSEFRFAGRPVPAMRSLQGSSEIFLIGTFNKTLFPALRMGYMVVPDRWMEPLLRLRHQTDRYAALLPQWVLAEFLREGHFARHLRRMRGIYGARLEALLRDARRYLEGALAIPPVLAGLNTASTLSAEWKAPALAARGKEVGLELWPMQQFALRRRDLNGFLLGFGAFTERQVREGVLSLAALLETRG